MSTPDRKLAAWAWCIIASGIAIRLWHYLANRSLYIDEARLALNIGTRSFAGLFRPLDLEQVAPVPFLLATKASTAVLGMNEYALRLVPLLAGCTMLWPMWRLSRRLLEPVPALLALALVAYSPAMVRATNDAKPYVLDALLTVLLMLVALRLMDRAPSKRELAMASLTCVAATVTSFPALMVSCAVVLTLAWQEALRQRAGHAGVILLGGAATLAAAVVPYHVLYSTVASSDYMAEFWSGAFLVGQVTRDASIAANVVWGWMLGGLPTLRFPPDVRLAIGILAVAVLFLVAMGIRPIHRRNGLRVPVLLCLPVGLLVGLNLIGFYPIALRLLLFALPLLSLLLAAAAGEAIERAAPGRQLAATVLACSCLFVGMLPVGLVPRLWPYHWQELRVAMPVLGTLGEDASVYINAGAVPAWVFYTTKWSSPDSARLRWYMDVASAHGAAFENSAALAASSDVAALERRTAGRRELVGARTGVQYRPYRQSGSYAQPDAWVQLEVERIERAATERSWLVFANYRRGENGILDELERRGHRIERRETALGAGIFLLVLHRRGV